MTTATTIDCPACGEEIKKIAKKCKHCGEFIEQKQEETVTPEPVPATKDCHACGEEVKFIAKKCKHCGEALSDQGSLEPPTKEQTALLQEVLDNKLLWAVALVPLIGAVLILVGGAGLASCLMLTGYVVFCLLDISTLKKNGQKHPHRAWILLTPVYIWRRITVTNLRRTAFWGWCTSAVVWFIMLLVVAGSSVNIEGNACNIINEKILSNSSLSCENVVQLEEVREGVYRAKALLSDGSEERLKGDMMYVERY